MPTRLGVFGGTFDPPHLGHLALAEWARERLGLQRVLFVPAGQPPHKHARRLSPARQRLDMTRLATRGNPAFAVSSAELTRPGPSYTVETLRGLRREFRDSRLYLLIGSDSLGEFPTWKDPQEILSLATLAVAARPGARPRVPAWARRGRVVWLENPGLDISSSLVRARARAGRSVRYLVPDALVAYLARHRIYAAPSRRTGPRAEAALASAGRRGTG